MNEIKYPQIEKLLHHRYPFILVDKVVEIDPGKRGVGLKNLTAGDFFFNFYGMVTPTMPQVMMIECLAQTAAIVAGSVDGNGSRSVAGQGLMVGIDNFTFSHNPQPGDQLYLHVESYRQYGNLHKFTAWIMIKDKEAARGELTFALY